MFDFFQQFFDFISYAFKSIGFIIQSIGAGAELLTNTVTGDGFGYMLSVVIGATVSVLVVRQIFAVFTGGNNN